MLDFNPIQSTDTVFLGDSLTESFDLVKHFGRNDLRNRGMSGNMTDHVLYRLEEITNAQPAKLFLMIGINDLYQGFDPERVYDNILKIISSIREESSRTVCYIQSILPVNEARLLSGNDINTTVYKMNRKLSEYCKEDAQLNYIDLHSEFLNNAGEMDTTYTYDGVHLTDAGYVLWAELLADPLSGS